MRKISKNRAEDDVVSSTSGSIHDEETEAANGKDQIDKDEGAAAIADGDSDDDAIDAKNEDNDRESDVSYSGKKETPKKSKPKKKSKKGKAVEEEYEVEKIIDAKKIKGKLHYLIRWKGYGANNDTWEPEKTVSCPDLVTKFKDEKEIAHKDESENKETEKRGRKRKSKSESKSPAKKPKTEWDTAKDGENAEYEVERIMEVHHKKDGAREFLIHWKGWSSKFDSWEPEDNLNCSDLIKRFMDKVDVARKTQSRSLRVAPETTNRFTLQDPSSGRRLSKRRGQRQSCDTGTLSSWSEGSAEGDSGVNLVQHDALGELYDHQPVSGSSRSPSLRLPDDLSDEEDAKQKHLWLKNSTKPWAAIEQKWIETTNSRLIASKDSTRAE